MGLFNRTQISFEAPAASTPPTPPPPLRPQSYQLLGTLCKPPTPSSLSRPPRGSLVLCRLWRSLRTPFPRLPPPPPPTHTHLSPHRPPTSGLICPTIGVFKNTFLVLDVFFFFLFFSSSSLFHAIFPAYRHLPPPPPPAFFLVILLVSPPPTYPFYFGLAASSISPYTPPFL